MTSLFYVSVIVMVVVLLTCPQYNSFLFQLCPIAPPIATMHDGKASDVMAAGRDSPA